MPHWLQLWKPFWISWDVWGKAELRTVTVVHNCEWEIPHEWQVFKWGKHRTKWCFFFQPAVFDCRRVLIHALIISSSAEIQECKVQLYQVSKPTAEHFHHCAVQAPGVDVWFFSCPLENGNIGDSLDGYFKYINYMYIYIHMYAHLISFNYIYTHTTVYIYIHTYYVNYFHLLPWKHTIQTFICFQYL